MRNKVSIHIVSIHNNYRYTVLHKCLSRKNNIMPEDKLYIDRPVRELIEDRDGRKVIAGLDRTELLDLLECLCTE